ncbi:hypothetical protein [Deinococcus aquatilis]|uniref:hypothetical protein n=1 Tax=Deinococcus aquatilis TaxID=519440 RepID=UPI0003825EEC|nr:hypothetical protein [Deinococcus aquatilis]
MRLGDLLDRVHLPDVIARECGPDAVRGLTRERGGVICDPRPSQRETHPSFSVYKDTKGRWRWKRHGGDGASGDTLTFLEAIGYRPEHAREELARHAGESLDSWTPSPSRPAYEAPDPLRAVRGALERCAPLSGDDLARVPVLLDYLSLQNAAGRDLKRRGLYGWHGLGAGQLRRDFITKDGRMLAHAGALAFLLRGPDGQAWGLKVRSMGTADALQASGLDRYVYRIGRHGAPAWCSPKYGQGAGVLIVEGELNGAAAARALKLAGSSLDVQGLAGAGGAPFLTGLQGQTVFLYTDPDTAGAACLERVAGVAHAAGAREVRVLAPFSEGDFCDLCGTHGAAAFGGLLMERVDGADYWQNVITGKNALPVKSTVPHGENRLLANWQYSSGWGESDTSGWGTDAGGWASDDRGGW